jgi:hypothetical protein
MRFSQMPDLVRQSRTAFVLLYALAFRARWNADAFNPYGLALGEALCDYHNWGLTEQEFRTAKATIKAWSLATFRATSRGTIGKLIDTRLFSVLPAQSNEPSNVWGNDIPRTKSKRAKELKNPEGAHAWLDKSSRVSRVDGGVALLPLEARQQFEAQSRKLGEECGLNEEHVERFIAQHRRDGWTIKNCRTQKRERIKHLEKALSGFCAKLESDRKQ